MKTYKGLITSLGPNEVFIFTSNYQGFHGAGSAGYATFGESGNVWRKYNYDKWPDGTKGKWNVKGQSRGFMEGTEGISYAIPTVTRCGAKRSISLNTIKEYINIFNRVARMNPELTFYVAQAATPGLNGYSALEMASVWFAFEWPDNVYFEEEFAKLLSTAVTPDIN